jgi:hypothetical protein
LSIGTAASLIFNVSHRIPGHDKLLSLRFPQPWERDKTITHSIAVFSERPDNILHAGGTVVDSDLVVLDAAHLFDAHTTWIGFRRGALMRGFMYEFIERLAPHLSRERVRAAEKLETQEEVDTVSEKFRMPHDK